MMVIVEHGDAPPIEPTRRAIHPHRTPREVHDQLLRAAGRFAWIWRLHRAALVLAWIALLATTILAAMGLVALARIPALDGAMLIAGWMAMSALSVLHAGSTDGLLDRILAHRLCLTCGHSLLQETVDEKETGRCPSCRRRFSLAEYASPTACLGRAEGRPAQTR